MLSVHKLQQASIAFGLVSSYGAEANNSKRASYVLFTKYTICEACSPSTSSAGILVHAPDGFVPAL